jgi:hypothetical protein
VNTDQIEIARRLREQALGLREDFAATRARILDVSNAAKRACRAVSDTVGSERDEPAPTAPHA